MVDRRVACGADSGRLAEVGWKAESHTNAQFLNGPAIDERVAHRRIEGEFVIYLPDSPGQSGKRLRLVDYAVGIDFEDWSNYPFVGPFDDGVEEKLTMLVG